MSGIGLRSTRQRSKPVIIDLRKTDFGYELYEEKLVNPIANLKNAMPKPEKPLNYSKTLMPKSVEKVASPPPNFNQTPDALNRSRTMINKPPLSNQKISFQNGVPITERNMLNRPSDFAIKKEIYPFSNLSMPPVRMSTMQENTGISDLNISSQFEKVPGPSLGHPLHESGYLRPVERPQKKYSYVFPSCASWFDVEKIHQIEKDFVPEFFLGKPTKTPESYKRIRNFMINLYRQNPSNYLNATTCRKSLGGDACSLMRIHSFLEHWGLINFYIDPASYPKSYFLNKTGSTAETFLEFPNKDIKMDIIDDAIKSNFISNENNALIDQIKTLDKYERPICDFCGMGCGKIWYLQKSSNQLQATELPEAVDAEKAINHVLPENNIPKIPNEKRSIFCVECFKNRKFPSPLTEEYFDKVDLIGGLGSDSLKIQALGVWSQDETFKLLELIQKHGDNWIEIQKNFPTKTKDDIVTHYLRLPFEFVTSINILEAGEQRGHEDTPDERIVDRIPTIFGDYSNPILQHVAVFRSMLNTYRSQRKSKKKLIAGEHEQNAMDTKIEEESNPEITKITDMKEEALSVTGQTTMEPTNGQSLQSQSKPVVNSTINKEDKMEEELANNKLASKAIANKLVEKQIEKLNIKVDFLDEYEKILLHERKQQDVLQQGLAADKVDIARIRNQVLKQNQPVYNEPPQGAIFDPKDAAYFEFNHNGGNFNADDLLDLGMTKLDEFQKDEF